MPNNVKLPEQKVEEVEYKYVHNITYHVIDKLREKLPKHGTVVVYGIPRGGLLPAILLCNLLEKERQVRFVSSLDHLDPGDWHRLVIVDELVDSGDTIKSIKDRYPESITVAFYQRKSAAYRADVVGRVVDHDDWLIFPWERV